MRRGWFLCQSEVAGHVVLLVMTRWQRKEGEPTGQKNEEIRCAIGSLPDPDRMSA